MRTVRIWWSVTSQQCVYILSVTGQGRQLGQITLYSDVTWSAISFYLLHVFVIFVN